MEAVNKDMTIYEVLQLNPEVAPVFFGFGMHCLHCPTARGETLEQAAAAHGIELSDMMDKLNAFFDQE
ncbi:MAG: DUF1858 domain-containing protein [Clostridiales bacterium]|jgi:hybrid cluster-associated redox disulfide protein|nr:DUF1858 domain-containing protein [Clostridiales bacterium]